MTEKMFYSVDGKTMTLEEFIQSLFNTLDMPEFFKNEEELRAIWSVPTTRKQLLHNLENAGFPQKQLEDIQDLIDARSSDLFDVLEYVKYHFTPVMREARAVISRSIMETELTARQMEFVDFLVQQYVVAGVDELDDSKLETLLAIKYKTATEGVAILGSVDVARRIFLTRSTFISLIKRMRWPAIERNGNTMSRYFRSFWAAAGSCSFHVKRQS
jgi:type I restriction enzyme R subunit